MRRSGTHSPKSSKRCSRTLRRGGADSRIGSKCPGRCLDRIHIPFCTFDRCFVVSLVLHRAENLQWGVIDDSHIDFILAVAFCVVVCLLACQCIYTRSYPHLTCLPLSQLRTVYPHPLDRLFQFQLLAKPRARTMGNRSCNWEGEKKARRTNIGTINRFDYSRIRKRPS
jgi:hypothetical protein